MRTTSSTGGKSPSNIADHFAPRYIVGNVPANDPAVAQAQPFRYIGDPGDGSGIAQALAEAAITPGDVWIRPGTYTRPVGAALLAIPAGCTVRASGIGTTFIVASAGAANATQDVFSLGANAELSDLTITVPAGAGGGLLGSGIVQMLGATSRVRRVAIRMPGTSQRNTPFGISSGTGAYPGETLVEDCIIQMPGAASAGPAPYFAIGYGTGAADSTGVTGPKVIGCTITGGQVGVAMFSCNGGVVDDCEITGLVISVGGSNGILWQLLTSALTTVNGPRVTSTTVQVSVTGDGVGATAACILISNAVTAAVVAVDGTVVDGCKFFYDTGANLVSARQAIKLRIETNGIGQLVRGVVSDCIVRGAGTAVFVQTNTASATANRGIITDWVFEGIVAPTPIVYGAFTTAGLQLEVATHGLGTKIRRVTIDGCNFANAPATGFGVILDADCINTILTNNQLTPNGGTAISDTSTTPEISGNIET